jgi:dihydrofolate reductase
VSNVLAARMATLHDTPPPEAAPNAPTLAVVVAVAANRVIGRDNALPWHLPPDLKHFRAITTGHAMLMGRKTWEAIGRPLPGRQSIVITRQTGYVAPGAVVVHSLDEALARVTMPLPACCIGGEEIFRLALPRVHIMYLTEIDRAFEGDARFPAFDRREWVEMSREEHGPGPHGDYRFAFVTLVRRMS